MIGSVWLEKCAPCALTAEQQEGAGLDSPAGRSGPFPCTAGSPQAQCPGPAYGNKGRRRDRERAAVEYLHSNKLHVLNYSAHSFICESLPHTEGEGIKPPHQQQLDPQLEGSQCCGLERYEGDNLSSYNL